MVTIQIVPLTGNKLDKERGKGLDLTIDKLDE
jgi:hypothetical protein